MHGKPPNSDTHQGMMQYSSVFLIYLQKAFKNLLLKEVIFGCLTEKKYFCKIFAICKMPCLPACLHVTGNGEACPKLNVFH